MSEAPRLDRPVFIIGCNRSGTTLMFRTMSDHPLVWSYYEELQGIYHEVSPVDPHRGERITEAPSLQAVHELKDALYEAAHNKEVFRDVPALRFLPRKLFQRPLNVLYKRPPIRFVEKTPANSLRVPLLAEVFPDARFIFLVRRAEAVISSLMEGWKFWSESPEEDWSYGEWHYLVPPGWQDWTDRKLEEICAFQWLEANRTAWEDLETCCPDRYVLVRHEEALAAPRGVYREVREFCELPASDYYDRQVARLDERTFTHHGSEPRKGKWRDLHGAEVESVRPMFQPLMDRLYPDL